MIQFTSVMSRPMGRNDMNGVYNTIIKAQRALANKKKQSDWIIVKTENNWFLLTKKTSHQNRGVVRIDVIKP